MRVHIGPIKGTRGAAMSVDFEERLPLAQDDLRKIVGPVSVKARVTNTGRCYLVHAVVQADATAACDRCLEPTRFPVQFEFEEEFCPRSAARPAADEYEGDDSGDTGDERKEANFFEGDAFELDDIVGEYLLLALPVKVTCRDECRGLCPQCGQNLNTAVCDCDVQPVDPRLAPLKGLLGPEDRS